MDSGKRRQASLPEDLEEETIDNMVTGQVAYIVPWGMWVDSERHCWLHPKYTVFDVPKGTVQMRVELSEDGYHVWPPVGYTWQPSAEPGYMSPSNTEYIPVAQLHR